MSTEDNAYQASDNQQVDPCFVDVGSFDFHLKASSPAIDAGIVLKVGLAQKEIAEDVEGVTRPQGGTPDIGAYEFLPTTEPLRVHPSNRRYFTDGTKNADGSLRAVYVTGSHHWNNLQDSAKLGKPLTEKFDYEGYLRFLGKFHHNFMRMWSWEVGENDLYYEPAPWVRTGPGTASDGKAKFDLKQFNPEYFKRLRSRVIAACNKGIYVSIMLFQGWSIYSHDYGNPWPVHPFNKGNNINGINGDLDNVLYEITNETAIFSNDWQYHIIRYIKDYEATKPNQHPVGITAFDSGREGSMKALFASPADWISPQNDGASGDYRDDPPAADGRNNIVFKNEGDIADYATGTGTILSNNFTNDPKFVDAATDDFRLRDGSPVIDQGVDLRGQGVTADIEGRPRPQGKAFDIGAFEHPTKKKEDVNCRALESDDSNTGASEVRGANLPSGNPPEPLGRVINVAAFGVDLADNDFDDTDAVSAAIVSAGDNCTLYFPKGVYNVRWVCKIEKAKGLSIKGDGPTESIMKLMGPFWREGLAHTYENLRAGYTTDCKILMIEDCRDMCIRDMGFDANGTPTFGGVGIKRPKRLNITNTRYIDSREQPALFGKDRYAWCILGYEEGGRDIWFTDNVVEGLQVEMDGVDRAVVERNILKRSVKSPCIGFLSGDFSSPAEFARGYSNTNITIRNIYFSNSRNLSMGMVTFQLDPATNCNSVFRNIEIVGNVFVYDIDSENGHAAIKLGAGDSSLPTKGNVFEKFRIEGNRIYRKPDVNIGEKFNTYIWYNCWAGEHRLNRSVIRKNVLYTDAEAKPLLGIGRKNQSIDLIVEDNHVRPYQPPPSGVAE